MTWMLASVRDVAEARVALEAGADVIDFKDPAQGALGAVAVQLVTQCVAEIGGRRLTSAALGEAGTEPRALAAAVQEMSDTGVDLIKIGLPRLDQGDICLDAIAASAGRCSLIAVLFADLGFELHSVERLARAGVRGVMLDTAGKSAGGLRQHVRDDELHAFAGAARAHGLLCGFAGSLGREDVPPLLRSAPDVLGFRGALCLAGNRLAALDRAACRALREAIPAPSRLSGGPPIRSSGCPSASTAWSGADPW